MTEEADRRFKWNYHVFNDNFFHGADGYWGVGYLTINAPDTDGIEVLKL